MLCWEARQRYPRHDEKPAAAASWCSMLSCAARQTRPMSSRCCIAGSEAQRLAVREMPSHSRCCRHALDGCHA
jgi:hypothetical protein